MTLRFRSFRARVLTFVIGLLLVVLGAVLVSVHVANLRGARGHVDEALGLTAAAFRRSLETRERILIERARLLSSDFAFKEVFAAGDRATLLSALRNHSARVGADAMMLLAPDGEVVADTLHPEVHGVTSELMPLLREAMDDEYGEASGIQSLDGAHYQMVVVPLFAPEPSAWIAIGFAIDDALARGLQEETGTHVTLARRGAAGWSAFCTTLEPPVRRALEEALPSISGETGRSVSLELAGDEYVSWIDPMEGAELELVAVLQRSLDEALEPFLELRAWLLGIFAVGIALSLAGGRILASRVTRPVSRLARGARRIERGDYEKPVAVDQDDELGALARSFNAMMRGLDERDRVRDLLGRVVAPEVAEELLREEIRLGGEERRVTVLFADIRGFTSRSEREDPQRLVRVVNLFLTAVSDAIDDAGGVVEEYMGDGVKALFGAPVGHADDAARAVRAGLGILERLPAVNGEIAALGAEPLAIGIGIHTGEAVAGRMGSLSRLKYTVVGDAVNLAARLEGLTRHYGVSILVSGATRDACPDLSFREVDRVRVKGRSAPVTIHEPTPAGIGTPDVREALARHEAALARFRARDWDAAEVAFREEAARRPDDPICRLYLERIARLRADPPGPDWDGTVSHDWK